MPDLASANEVSAMEEAEEKPFLAADNGQMPQLGEGRREESQDKSIWRDLEQFLPVGDPSKMDEIKNLYGVSRAYNSRSRSCKGEANFYYIRCFLIKSTKCKYVVRWRKADGMVQAKGEHNHKKGNNSLLLANNEGMPTQMEDVKEEGQDKSIWRDLEQFLPVGDPAKMDKIKNLYGVSRPIDKEMSNFIYLQCCSKRKYKCQYTVRWRKADGLVQAKGEHSHKELKGAGGRGREEIWRDLEQFLPVGDRDKVEEIRSLYGVSGSYASCKPNRNFIYLQCSSLQKYKCSYILRWRKADGLVQAKGEHCHKDFILPRMEPRPRYKPNKCRECPFETDQIALMREHYGQFHTDKLYFHCDHCPANFTRLFDCKKHILGHEKANQQGDGTAAEWQLEEETDMEEDPNDNLDDLRAIFADAIADELRKERLRLTARRTSASSSVVNQHLNNPPPLLNPETGFEMVAEHSWWDSP